MGGQAVGRDHVEPGPGQQHHPGRPGLPVAGRLGLQQGRLAGDVQVVGPGLQAGVGQRAGGPAERAGAVQNDRKAPNAGRDDVRGVQRERAVLQPQLAGEPGHPARVAAGQDGPQAPAGGLAGDERAGVPGGPVDQEVGHPARPPGNDERGRRSSGPSIGRPGRGPEPEA